MVDSEWIIEEDYGNPHQYNEPEPELSMHEKEVDTLLRLVKDIECDMKNYDMNEYQNMRAKNDIAHYYEKISVIKNNHSEYFI